MIKEIKNILQGNTDTAINGQTEATPLNVIEADVCTSLIAQENNAITEKAKTVGGICVVPYCEGNLLSMKIPDEEKAVEAANEDLSKMDRAWDAISSPILHDMANLQGILNNSLYAGIRENHTGERMIAFCQRYRSGTLSPTISIPQADIYEYQECCSGNSKEASKIIKKMRREYLNKFSGYPDERLDTREIMHALYTTACALPKQDDNSARLERKEFYNDVVEVAKAIPTQILYDYKAYYPLEECDIVSIAMAMKMHKVQLLRKLRSYGLLYLEPSSSGYQSNVRIKDHNGSSHTEWRYCIFKVEYLAGITTNSSTDWDLEF